MDEDFLKKKLDERYSSGNLRQLPRQSGLMDFVSNDYLGLARNAELASIIRITEDEIRPVIGSTGSRLLSGNHPFYEEVENQLKSVFDSEAVLVFNSGYHANQSLVSSIAEKGDTIIYDQLSHVCLKEGAWLSKADTIAFRHNNLNDLEQKLVLTKGRKFVVTETIFSMDGDIAPLEDIIEICEKYEAYLIIDEAHSTGAFGKAGSGLLNEKGLAQRVFARVYTFGKAMGVHGACVAGSQTLINYLINFARPFIYTTGLPPLSLIAISESFKYLKDHLNLQNELKSRIQTFRNGFSDAMSETAIQPIIIGSNEKAKKISGMLADDGFDVRPILSPTVQKGKERLRISLHTFNSEDQIHLLTSTLNRVI
ncbi:MAG: aminotransferase class I/II-fold pyridoxal phosphate-dependent enzyme [Bacteroidota bacterium]